MTAPVTTSSLSATANQFWWGAVGSATDPPSCSIVTSLTSASRRLSAPPFYSNRAVGAVGKAPAPCPPSPRVVASARHDKPIGGWATMADYGVAVTWGDPKPGREKKALELWADSVAVNEKAVANGRIESWDAVIFEPTASPPAGAIRLHGSQDQIDQFVRSEDFQDIINRATLLLS